MNAAEIKYEIAVSIKICVIKILSILYPQYWIQDIY
jgi:hypothetical protein